MATKICPRCKFEGDVEENFGWRTVAGKRYPQSQCGKCRGRAPLEARGPHPKKAKPAPVLKARNAVKLPKLPEVIHASAAKIQILPLPPSSKEHVQRLYREQFPNDKAGQITKGRGSRSLNFMLAKLEKKGIAA